MRNVLEWLEETAACRSDAMAFADDRSLMTFGELLERSRTIGGALAQELEPCQPVPILARKSPECVAAMLGAVQARGCYCVLDERQPDARLQSIVKTLGAGLALADADHADQAREALEPLGVRVQVIGELDVNPAQEQVLAARRADALDTDPLYVNFTSGSTGTPKGVVVSHRSVIDFIGQFTTLFGITSDDRIANQAPLDFDVSVKDLYSGLSMGAAVHLVPRDYFSVPTQLMDFLASRQVTVCTWAVSAMCFVSIMGGFDYKEVPSIRLVVFSGEIMPVKQLNVWRAHLPNAQFINVYGPTEVTCNCTYYRLQRAFQRGENIPIGKPFPNEKVFLLGDDDVLVEGPGVPGEICVAGTALALGYYNDPAKTAAAFVQNPLNSAFPETVYRTGDLAQYDEAGDLVYIGRKDHQVKHMGQRIELGEIESVAQAVDGVDRACCLYDERKKRILMYYSGEVDKAALAENLKVLLPSYMVPNKIFQVDAMPLTKNGKIDRMKLAQTK